MTEKTWEQQFTENLHGAYRDLSANAEDQPDREHDARNLAHSILVLCRLAGFRLEGRLHLVDKKTGRVFR